MKRFERFGISADSMRSYLRGSLRGFAPRTQKFEEHGRSMRLTAGVEVLYVAHMEYDIGELKPRAVACELTHLALDFLFGRWRTLADNPALSENERLQVAASGAWLGEYRKGLLCALLCDQEPELKLLQDYPTRERSFIDSAFPLKQTDQDWYLLLSQWLRKEELDVESIDSINQSRDKRPKLLLRSLLDLIAGGDAFADSFTEYMVSFRDREWDGSPGIYFTSPEATILWNIARRSGVKRPDLASVVEEKPKFKVKRPGVKVPMLTTNLSDYLLFPDGIGGS